MRNSPLSNHKCWSYIPKVVLWNKKYAKRKNVRFFFIFFKKKKRRKEKKEDGLWGWIRNHCSRTVNALETELSCNVSGMWSFSSICCIPQNVWLTSDKMHKQFCLLLTAFSWIWLTHFKTSIKNDNQ